LNGILWVAENRGIVWIGKVANVVAVTRGRLLMYWALKKRKWWRP
jgi:hypothetical protein